MEKDPALSNRSYLELNNNFSADKKKENRNSLKLKSNKLYNDKLRVEFIDYLNQSLYRNIPFTSIVKQEHKAFLHLPGSDGRCVLHVASEMGNVDFVTFLIDTLKVDPNSYDSTGSLSLYFSLPFYPSAFFLFHFSCLFLPPSPLGFLLILPLHIHMFLVWFFTVPSICIPQRG